MLWYICASDIRTEDATLDLQIGESVNESQTNTNLPRKKVVGNKCCL